MEEADRDRVLGLAAETAFFVVLGLFPTLLLVVAVLGYLDALVGQTSRPASRTRRSSGPASC